MCEYTAGPPIVALISKKTTSMMGESKIRAQVAITTSASLFVRPPSGAGRASPACLAELCEPLAAPWRPVPALSKDAAGDVRPQSNGTTVSYRALTFVGALFDDFRVWPKLRRGVRLPKTLEVMGVSANR
ncbi:hypothetical protein [Mesorhizobium sp. ANAO-SY3R2]|uniref:hypothetical protein n=1 Tax=Mesorhizobium sp. ANAO-SY3R2 TaxID=3166644 RepID=UPI00367116A0